MTDRPILFSGSMIRALLAGTKTQTRRVITNRSATVLGERWGSKSWAGLHFEDAFVRATSPISGACDVNLGVPFWHPEDGPYPGKEECGIYRVRPIIEIGDRLWVRETWTHTGLGVWDISSARLSGRSGVHYRADGEISGAGYFPSIFLPREFSRLTLYVTDVRVERLQDISEADARAEGAGLYVPGHGFITEDELRADPGYSNFLAPCLGFEAIWTEINGPGSWAENPWVAAYTFIPRLGNIDTLPATLEEAA